MEVSGNFLTLNSEKEDRLKESVLGTVQVGQFVIVAPTTVKLPGFSRLAVNVSDKPQSDFQNKDGIAKLTSPFIFSQQKNFDIHNLSPYKGRSWKCLSSETEERTRNDGTVFTVPVYKWEEVPTQETK